MDDEHFWTWRSTFLNTRWTHLKKENWHQSGKEILLNRRKIKTCEWRRLHVNIWWTFLIPGLNDKYFWTGIINEHLHGIHWWKLLKEGWKGLRLKKKWTLMKRDEHYWMRDESSKTSEISVNRKWTLEQTMNTTKERVNPCRWVLNNFEHWRTLLSKRWILKNVWWTFLDRELTLLNRA